MIIQIYEIQRPEEAARCIELGVNHIGSVVLDQDEWRMPLLRETVRLSQRSGVKSSLIPLFQDKETIFRVLDYYGPDMLHLCDSLTEDKSRSVALKRHIHFQAELKERFPEIKIMRSIPVPAEAGESKFPSLEIAHLLRPSSDLFLIDTWVPEAPEEGYIGITGRMADRKLSRTLVQESPIPVILAGGLSPENVYEALMSVRPAGADSCTLTNQVTNEKKPIRFQKDFHKVQRFVEAVRRVEMELQREKEALLERLDKLKEDLKDREAALPAHSVRPNQILAIEALEEAIEAVEKKLERYD